MCFSEIKKNLEAKGYKVTTCGSAKDAASYLDRELDGISIGIGGSMTIDALGVYETLKTHNEVYWHFKTPSDSDPVTQRQKAAEADVYLSSVNAISVGGEIVNIDGHCNRVASTQYGHKKVYFLVGKNKITEDCESAIWRARNIAAPLNAKRLGKKTPCAIRADKCYDCKSPERICRALSVFFTKPTAMEYEVVLIDEELGY